MSQNSVSGGTLVLAFLGGAVAGAALAVLFAPASGEETRHLLQEKARESRERAAQAARQGSEFIHRQRETVHGAIERGREAYQQARTAPVEETM